jgi:hypothetical protein
MLADSPLRVASAVPGLDHPAYVVPVCLAATSGRDRVKP